MLPMKTCSKRKCLFILSLAKPRYNTEFLKLISCLFMEANLTLLIKFVNMGKK